MIRSVSLLDIIRLIPGYDPFATAGDAWFDAEAAQRPLDFFSECLTHIEGAMAKKPFILQLWQQAILANLFGWKRKDTTGRIVRRFRECLIYCPRKQGKTPFAAGLGLFVLFCDDEQGQQDYVAADTRETAGKLFRYAKGMVLNESELSSRCRVYGGHAEAGQSRSIIREDQNSFFRVISADGGVQHGGNTHLAIVDELHTQPNRELVDTLITSTASENRPNPLIVYLTTADFARDSVCNDKHDYACKVRDGILDDSAFLPVIYEATNDQDWKSEEVWAAANPNLGVSVSLEYLRRECKRAQEEPSYENTFKRLHLNMQTEQDVRWLPMDLWNICEDRDGESTGECFGGLDLSTTTDLTALALVFPRDGGFDVLMKFWVPEEGARRREKKDRVPYSVWIREGLITATPGPVVDYDIVRRDVNELKKKYNIRQIAIDRWNATQITSQLMGDGLEMVEFGQGFASMSAPAKELERLVVSGKLRHGGHKVLTWCASNAAAELDAAGNIKPSKKKSTERIDGIVALTMAIGLASAAAPQGKSVYETRGLFKVGGKSA